MKPLFGLVLLLLGLSGCQNTYEYWDVSKFKMDRHALNDEEEVELIYSSRGPDDNLDLEYYIHLVVVSQESGDTVNILTTLNNSLDGVEGNRIFNFFDQDNIGTKIGQMDPETLLDIKNVEDITNREVPSIEKVARDRNFDDIADNDFPTIIGSIGILTSTQN